VALRPLKICSWGISHLLSVYVRWTNEQKTKNSSLYTYEFTFIIYDHTTFLNVEKQRIVRENICIGYMFTEAFTHIVTSLYQNHVYQIPYRVTLHCNRDLARTMLTKRLVCSKCLNLRKCFSYLLRNDNIRCSRYDSCNGGMPT
jgi:hypothetical protein